MNEDERNVLLCMTDAPRPLAAVAETVAEFTGARCTGSYIVVTYCRLLRMMMRGLVTVEGSGDPRVPPTARLTEDGLATQAKLIAENSEIQLRVCVAHIYTQGRIARRIAA